MPHKPINPAIQTARRRAALARRQHHAEAFPKNSQPQTPNPKLPTLKKAAK